MVQAEVWRPHPNAKVFREENKAKINHHYRRSQLLNHWLEINVVTRWIWKHLAQLILDENFEQMLNFTDLLWYKKQLDVFLTNEPQFWINSKIEIKISNNYALNNKKCADHYAYITRYENNYDQATDRRRTKYAYKRKDWINFNCNISKNPFNPYCYSNVDELLKQCCEWFNRLFEQNVPRVTQHRSQLPLWVSKSTSHEMKKLSTLKQKAIAHPSPAPSTLNKIDCLEEKVNTICKNDQSSMKARSSQHVNSAWFKNIYDQLKMSHHSQARCT